MAGEKSEQATSKRRSDERKKGNIFLSREVVIIASILVMFFALNSLMPFVAFNLQSCIRKFFYNSTVFTEIDKGTLTIVFINGFMYFLMCALPFLVLSGLVAIVFTALQTKMLFTFQNMKFKPSRLNPLSGLKRMFALKGAVELIKSLLKISILVYIIYNNVIKNMVNFARLTNMTVNSAVVLLGKTVMGIVYNICALFVVIAILDYLYQWWDYERNLKMTKQEVKEEYKQMEGDPQLKGKIKEMQRQMSNNRMMQDVPNADVIIRNPTHFAVALKYDPDVDVAPTVIAKGADLIAFKIIEIAEQHNIYTIENKPLARGLFSNVEIGMNIPEEFYQQVAEILAIVYNIKKKGLK